MTVSSAPKLLDSELYNAWVRVDLRALRDNAAAVKAHVSIGTSSPQLMAVVKANGYGHGAANAALAFRSGGATWFGVTSLAEAIELVSAGIDTASTPILLLAPLVTAESCVAALNLGLHLTVCDMGHVRLVKDATAVNGTTAHVHLKVDTGMGRLGLLPVDATNVAIEISHCPSLELTGVYTHFGCANESDLNTTIKQLNTFVSFCETLTRAGCAGFLRHCANSAALLRLPESRLDIVRAGTVLYGQYPAKGIPVVSGLNGNTLLLEARAVFVRDLVAGSSVGYGAEHVTTRKTRVAVLPVGFVDGVSMVPLSLTSGWRGIKLIASSLIKPRPTFVKFGSFHAPVLGRIAMQMMVVDVTGCPSDIVAGDIASVPARRLGISAGLPRILVDTEAVS